MPVRLPRLHPSEPVIQLPPQIHLRPSSLASSTTSHSSSPSHPKIPRSHPHHASLRTFCTTQPQPHPSQQPPSQSLPDHYTLLSLPPSAPPSALKKSFYALSLRVHPDKNPSDPHASQRFAQLADAYATLADPVKRAKYDREVYARITRQKAIRSQEWGGVKVPGADGEGGQGYRGGRAPTGLRRDRGTFRGPPPSFYAHGGRDGDSAYRPPPRQERGADGDAAGRDTGTEEGGWSGRRRSRRMEARMAAEREVEEDEGFWVRFVGVAGILLGGIMVGGALMGSGDGPAGRGGRGGGVINGEGKIRTETRKMKG